MSKITRRSLPALLASTAGLLSTALTADPGVDPVYAAINATVDANEDYLASLQAQENAERRFWEAREKLAVPTHGGVTLRSPEDVDSYLNRLFLRPNIRAAFAKKLGESASPELLDLAAKFESTEKDLAEMREHDALRERLHSEVGCYDAACEDLCRTTGLQAAVDRARQCGAVRCALSEAALATIPTTRAGAAALAAFGLSEVQEMANDEPATKALATLASFFSRLA